MIVKAHITSGGIVAFLHRNLIAQLSHHLTQIGFPIGESLPHLCSVHSLCPCKSFWYASWTLALVFWTGARVHGNGGLVSMQIRNNMCRHLPRAICSGDHGQMWHTHCKSCHRSSTCIRWYGSRCTRCKLKCMSILSTAQPDAAVVDGCYAPESTCNCHQPFHWPCVHDYKAWAEGWPCNILQDIGMYRHACVRRISLVLNLTCTSAWGVVRLDTWNRAPSMSGRPCGCKHPLITATVSSARELH